MLTVERDAENVIAAARIVDDSAAAVTDLVYNSAGLSVEYKLANATTWTALSLVAGTLGTWIDSGFIADAGGDGWYQIGFPAAAIVAGQTTRLRIKTAGNGYRYGFIAATASDPGEVIAAISSGGAYPITWPLTDEETAVRELVKRDDYAGDRAILIDVATSEDLTGATIVFGAGREGQTIAGTAAVLSDLGSNQYRLAVTVTAAEMTKPIGIYGWDVVATLATGKEVTLRRGRFELLNKYSAAAA